MPIVRTNQLVAQSLESLAGPFDIRLDKVGVEDSNGESLLSDISLNFRPGEFVAFRGENGSGKSVLANIIAAKGFRDEAPTQGSVSYGGVDVYSLPKAERTKLRSEWLGIVLQKSEFGLVPNLTVMRNLRFAANFRCVDIDEDALTDAIDYYDLGGLLNKPIKPLSGGVKRRISYAKAEVTNPRVIVMDEPAAALSPQAADKLHYRLYSLAAYRGKTVIIVSHEREPVAQRTIEVSQGSILSDTADL